MDVIRRNTDYGLRMMVEMAMNYVQLLSARQLTDIGQFSYQLGCKLLQKLHDAKLVNSVMGTKGGFTLSRGPSEISLMQIIKALQGGVRLNQCLLDGPGCELKPNCPINAKLSHLQGYIDIFLDGISLADFVGAKTAKEKNNG
jgi:Rrf2 family transcriptional regulator, iron-sulfur cluster assembly transcription factor